MKKVISFVCQYKKWIWVIAYLIVILLAWHQRYTTYPHVPSLFRETLLGDLLLDMVFFALALAGFACLIQLIRTPPFMAMRFQRACKRNDIKNSTHEYPRLCSVQIDKDKLHSLIYKIDNMGVTVTAFEAKTEQLETALDIRIERIELGKKSSCTRLYATPRKYVTPTVISPNDEHFGKEDIGSVINCLVVGATGTGKTIALKVIMAKIARFQPEAKIWILDFKSYDFKEFSNYPNHYAYSDCVQGLTDFYNAFKAQQNTGSAGCPQYLFFDEWGSFILSREKRQAEELKARLSELLMLGRSYHFVPVIGLQRADSSYFLSGARDQFRAILMLGNISKEQKQMLLPDLKDRLTDNNGLAEGYLLLDGKGVERVKIASINDFTALNDNIRKAMQR